MAERINTLLESNTLLECGMRRMQDCSRGRRWGEEGRVRSQENNTYSILAKLGKLLHRKQFHDFPELIERGK